MFSAKQANSFSKMVNQMGVKSGMELYPDVIDQMIQLSCLRGNQTVAVSTWMLKPVEKILEEYGYRIIYTRGYGVITWMDEL